MFRRRRRALGPVAIAPPRAGITGAAVVQAEALRAFALISRRARQFDDAELAWRRVLELEGSPPHIVREATDALAVHYEHRRRDLRAAKSYALRSLGFEGSPSREGAIRHRVARLDRKLERAETIPALPLSRRHRTPPAFTRRGNFPVLAVLPLPNRS